MNTLDATELKDIAGILSLLAMLAWAAVLIVRFIISAIGDRLFEMIFNSWFLKSKQLLIMHFLIRGKGIVDEIYEVFLLFIGLSATSKLIEHDKFRIQIIEILISIKLLVNRIKTTTYYRTGI